MNLLLPAEDSDGTISGDFAFSDEYSRYLFFLTGSEHCPYLTASVEYFHKSRCQHTLEGFSDIIHHVINNAVETETDTFPVCRAPCARFSIGIETDNDRFGGNCQHNVVFVHIAG